MTPLARIAVQPRSALLRVAATAVSILGVAVLAIASVGSAADGGRRTTAGASLEARKQPMSFQWIACEPGCGGWISAVGIVTGDTPKVFEDFAAGRKLERAAVVLDSSGGSVNDAIALILFQTVA